MPARVVQVSVPSASYQVHVGPGLLAHLGGLLTTAIGTTPARATLIVDANLPAAQVDRARASLEDLGVATSISTLDPNEPAKSLATLESILVHLAESGHGRLDPVIALGGGIVCDIAGFVAASYQRGCPIVQCPTTLLAMADAAVGGKTAVNLCLTGGQLVKNLVGAFHQPALVIADTTALGSLDGRVFRAGLGECVKHALLGADWGDKDLLAWTEDHAGSILAHDDETLVELIARQVALKARVIAGDERELASSTVGGRALLNLGHTFAHAIEPIPALHPPGQPAPLQHGEAVALGLCAACHAAAAMGLAEPALGDRAGALLSEFGLATTVAGLPETATILAAMGLDKKVRQGVLRLVLPTGAGTCRVVDDPPAEIVAAAIDHLRAD